MLNHRDPVDGYYLQYYASYLGKDDYLYVAFQAKEILNPWVFLF
jgi:hypothetical protein